MKTSPDTSSRKPATSSDRTSERGSSATWPERKPLAEYRCANGHEWAEPPGRVTCPVCGAFDQIVWGNFDEVEAWLRANGHSPRATSRRAA